MELIIFIKANDCQILKKRLTAILQRLLLIFCWKTKMLIIDRTYEYACCPGVLLTSHICVVSIYKLID